MTSNTAASNRLLSLRTVVFVVLAALSLWAVLYPQPTAGPDSPWGRLYRRAGDTYVRFFYLVDSVYPRVMRDDPILRKALDYYRISGAMSLDHQEPLLPRALVLAGIGNTKQSEDVLRIALRKYRDGSGPRDMQALLLALEASPPTQAQMEAARHAVQGSAAGPLFLARVQLMNDDQESAAQELAKGHEQAKGLVLPLLGLAFVCGIILLSGALGLLWYVSSRLLRRDPLPEAPPRVQWGVREAVEGLILFFIIQIIVGPLFLVEPQLVTRQPLLLFLPSLLGVLGALLWVRRMAPGAKGLGWQDRHPWRHLLLGIAAAGVMVLPAIYLGQAMDALVKQPPSEHPLVPIFTEATTWPARISLLLGTVALVPILEETLFRGVLYGALRRHWSVGLAIAASAAIFAVGHPHTTLLGLLPYFGIGAVLAWLYERTGSLVAPAAAHATFNLFNVAVLLVLFR